VRPGGSGKPTFEKQPLGSPVQPCPAGSESTLSPVHWIEIELVGEDDSPVGWEEYAVELPDGTRAEGFLDRDGFARIENIQQPGACRISFPRLDQDAWTEVATLPARGPR
jgi:hypothetical protein